MSSLDYTQFICKCQVGTNGKVMKYQAALFRGPTLRKHCPGGNGQNSWGRVGSPILSNTPTNRTL